MRQKQTRPLHVSSTYRTYSPSAMTNAFQACKEKNMPVITAARMFGVPKTTLRDRVNGRIDPEACRSGPTALFNEEEESVFVSHIKRMAELGYGYWGVEILNMATNFAIFLKKRERENHPLSFKWYRAFVRRWPDMKLVNPKALSHYKAVATSRSNINIYFKKLKTVLKKHDLLDKPGCIYSVDKHDIQNEHIPLDIVCGRRRAPSASSQSSCTTTVLCCGNALGTHLPPYFIFKGQTMTKELLDGSSPGVQGTVSEMGGCDTYVFLEYLDTHFFKYFQRSSEDQPVILLLDGHKTRVSVSAMLWAKQHNVILFVLPACTSHILQPLDVACFSPLQTIFNSECQTFINNNPSQQITRDNVCALVCAAYIPALSISNLQLGFMNTGIFPFNPDVIDDSKLVSVSVSISPELEEAVVEKNESSNDHSVDIFIASEVVHPEDFFIASEVIITDKETYSHNQKISNLREILSGACISNDDTEEAISSDVKVTNCTKSKVTKRSKHESTTCSKKKQKFNH